MIAGSNFHLRTVMQNDLDELVRLLGDISMMGDFLHFELLSQAGMREEFIRSGFWNDTYRRLLIVDDEERIIGTTWIFRSVPYFDALELGYRLFYREHWGKGLMSEAMALTVDYVFSSNTVNRLEIRCDVANEAPAKVAKKLGFVHEGTTRKAVFARGEHRDMHLFSLLREEWASRSRPDRWRVAKAEQPG